MNELMIQDEASNIHPDMEEAARFKDTFLEALEKVSPDGAVAFIDGLIKASRDARTKEFKEILKTFINWKQEIVNAFQRNPVTGKKYTNGGPVERTTTSRHPRRIVLGDWFSKGSGIGSCPCSTTISC